MLPDDASTDEFWPIIRLNTGFTCISRIYISIKNSAITTTGTDKSRSQLVGSAQQDTKQQTGATVHAVQAKQFEFERLKKTKDNILN